MHCCCQSHIEHMHHTSSSTIGSLTSSVLLHHHHHQQYHQSPYSISSSRYLKIPTTHVASERSNLYVRSENASKGSAKNKLYVPPAVVVEITYSYLLYQYHQHEIVPEHPPAVVTESPSANSVPDTIYS